MDHQSLTLRYLLLLLTSLLWGSQFLFNVLALESYTPLAVASLRTFVGCLFLAGLIFFIPYFKQTTLPQITPYTTSSLWLMYICISLFEAVIPSILIAWSLYTVKTSEAAILIGTIPLLTILFDRWFGSRTPLRPQRVIAVVLGFIGLLILFANDLTTIDLSTHLLAKAALLTAAASFSLSIVLIAKLPSAIPAIVSARNILFAASCILLPMALLFAPSLWQPPTLSAIAATVTLGITSSGLAYTCFILLITYASATFAAFTNYLVPITGITLGMIFLGEQPSYPLALALVCVLAALVINEKKA